MTPYKPKGSKWRPHLESNQELTLRKGSLYPFNYEAKGENLI